MLIFEQEKETEIEFVYDRNKRDSLMFRFICFSLQEAFRRKFISEKIGAASIKK